MRWREIAYDPLPSQRRFHDSAARFKGFSGPIGSGKSQALCHEAIRLTYLNQGRWGLIGAPTYPMLRDATQAALFEILDSNQLPFEFNKADNVLTMKDTGSRVLFRSLEEFERLRGTNLAWFGVDELTYAPEQAWLRLQGRLRDPKASRLCGFGVWTPKGFDWVYRQFIESPVDGYEVVLAKPYENRHLLGAVPDFYDRLKNSYDEEFFKQEVLGAYLNVNAGMVYTAFDRTVHVKPAAVDWHRPLYWALDFNVDPMSSVVVQIIRGTVMVVAEIVLRKARTEDACQAFVDRFGKHPGPVKIFGDASGQNTKTTGDADYDIVKTNLRGHYSGPIEKCVPPGNPRVRHRILTMNAQLRNAAGDIGMYVDPSCKELIMDFEQVSYKPGTLEIDKERDKRRTHVSDALGYLVWQECRDKGPAGEMHGRLV